MTASGRRPLELEPVPSAPTCSPALGVPPRTPRWSADSLVTADLWGHPSHGMLRLPWYVARLRSGAMTAVTEPELVTDGGAVAVLDGHDGVGQVVTDRACTERRRAGPRPRHRRRRRPQQQPLRHRRLLDPRMAAAGVRRHPHHQRQPRHGAVGRHGEDRRRQPLVGRHPRREPRPGRPRHRQHRRRPRQDLRGAAARRADPGRAGRSTPTACPPPTPHVAIARAPRCRWRGHKGYGDLLHDGRPVRRADRHPATPPTSSAPTSRTSAAAAATSCSRCASTRSSPAPSSTARIDDLIAITKAVPARRRRRGDLLPRRDRGPSRDVGRARRRRACRTRRSPICASSADSCGVSTRRHHAEGGRLMFTVLVDLDVRPDHLEEFLSGIRTNARASPARRARLPALRRPPQRRTTPHRFVLYEIYADRAAFYERPPRRAALRRMARGRGPLRGARAATSTRSPPRRSPTTSRRIRPCRRPGDGSP